MFDVEIYKVFQNAGFPYHLLIRNVFNTIVIEMLKRYIAVCCSLAFLFLILLLKLYPTRGYSNIY